MTPKLTKKNMGNKYIAYARTSSNKIITLEKNFQTLETFDTSAQ